MKKTPSEIMLVRKKEKVGMAERKQKERTRKKEGLKVRKKVKTKTK